MPSLYYLPLLTRDEFDYYVSLKHDPYFTHFANIVDAHGLNVRFADELDPFEDVDTLYVLGHGSMRATLSLRPTEKGEGWSEDRAITPEQLCGHLLGRFPAPAHLCMTNGQRLLPYAIERIKIFACLSGLKCGQERSFARRLSLSLKINGEPEITVFGYTGLTEWREWLDNGQPRIKNVMRGYWEKDRAKERRVEFGPGKRTDKYTRKKLPNTSEQVLSTFKSHRKFKKKR